MGGKSSIAHEVWARFGDVPNYVEPFFGGGAVLLARPHAPGVETVNDLNGWLCNFWRAVQADPDAVGAYASDPVNELDLHARGDWLFYRPGVDVEFIERLRGDPAFYDAQSAGWWVWGQCAWIGDNWGRRECRKRPHLGAGQGVMDTSRRAAITQYMRQLCERMCRVRVCCGDWSRVMGETPTIHMGMTGVFLDPPYGVADRDGVYGEHESRDVAADVLAWCIEHGCDPLLRIALCGYEGEHNELEARGWMVHAWKTRGGYGSQSAAGNNNGSRERIWFSPNCIQDQEPLFSSPLAAKAQEGGAK